MKKNLIHRRLEQVFSFLEPLYQKLPGDRAQLLFVQALIAAAMASLGLAIAWIPYTAALLLYRLGLITSDDWGPITRFALTISAVCVGVPFIWLLCSTVRIIIRPPSVKSDDIDELPPLPKHGEGLPLKEQSGAKENEPTPRE